MNETYNIPFTNKSDSIVIEPYDVDISTSLAFYGKNTLNYWTDLNKNILMLLTNFSNHKPPEKAIVGQTWFDNTVNELKYYDGVDWYRLVSPPVDLSQCISIKNDSLLGNLVLSADPVNLTSIATRAYVESKGVDYTHGSANNINWIRHANNYTVMNTYTTQNRQVVALPFPMADTNYTIITTPNEKTKGIKGAMHYTTYNKTVDEFALNVYGEMDTMSIVIMGFAA